MTQGLDFSLDLSSFLHAKNHSDDQRGVHVQINRMPLSIKVVMTMNMHDCENYDDFTSKCYSINILQQILSSSYRINQPEQNEVYFINVSSMFQISDLTYNTRK